MIGCLGLGRRCVVSERSGSFRQHDSLVMHVTVYSTDTPDNDETSDLEAHLEKYGGWTDLGDPESEGQYIHHRK